MADKKDDPPLISDRSPSYERARREHANPSPPGQGQVIAVLGRLAELSENAARALRTAAPRLTDGGAVLAEAERHDARRARLGELITQAGGAPPRDDECRPLLNHGAAQVTDATFEPDVVRELEAMRGELRDAWREAAGTPELDDGQRTTVTELARDLV
jgi:hypothetical protein